MDPGDLTKLATMMESVIARVYRSLFDSIQAIARKNPPGDEGTPDFSLAHAEAVNEGTGAATPQQPPQLEDVADSYGRTRLVLLAVNPYLVHAYWEVAPMDLEADGKALGESQGRTQAVLRFHDVTGVPLDRETPLSSFDVDIDLQARNWYVSLWKSDRSYRVDLGLRSEKDNYLVLARSNICHLPPARPAIKQEERPTADVAGIKPAEAASPEVEAQTEATQETAPPEVQHDTENREPESLQRESRVTEWAEPTESEPVAASKPVDSLELLRQKLEGLLALRDWQAPPSKPDFPVSLDEPASSEMCSDLTQVSEKDFRAGIPSSREG